MRVVLFFDLPVVSAKERHSYAVFRRKIIQAGFIMLQYSVYSKLVVNEQAAKSIETFISKIAPKYGSIQLLVVTERQFSKMRFISGEKQQKIVDSDSRLVII